MPPEETLKLTPEQIFQQTQAAILKMRGGQTMADVAAQPGDNPGPEVETKTISPEERKSNYVDPLRKSFEKLASASSAYRRLGTTKALDDPYGFLHQKDQTGKHYLISDGQLDAMAMSLLYLGAGDEGTPFQKWASTQVNQSSLIEAKLHGALSKGLFDKAAAKALDTTLSGGVGGGALIRTDLEPLLYEAYLRYFPVIDRVRSFPSNGITHGFNVRTAPGVASTISELGDLTAADSDSTIQRSNSSNIAIIVSRRGISLKLQFAVSQSGMSFPVTGSENMEVMGAMWAIARKNQALLLQGNFSTASKTLDDEEGVTDGNGYDGLRTLLKGAGTSITKASNETYRKVLNRAIAQIANAGGNVDNILILLSWAAEIAVEEEMEEFIRIIADKTGETGIRRNVLDGGLRTFGNIVSKFLPVPAAGQGDGLGWYDLASVQKEDMMVIDPMGMGLAYLGSATPSLLELPVGFNNRLSNVYVSFLMNGLVVHIPTFHRKVRIDRQTL